MKIEDAAKHLSRIYRPRAASLRRKKLPRPEPLALPLLEAEAQLASKVWRIGFVIPVSLPDAALGSSSMRRLPVFTQRMKELGWAEGQTFTVESRFTERDEQQLRSAALELARLPVDVIVAVSSPAVNAASAATVTIPIIAIDLDRRAFITVAGGVEAYSLRRRC